MISDENTTMDTDVNQTLLIVTIKIDKEERKVGAATINLHERRFMVSEFIDNEFFSGLESMIIQQNNSASDQSFFVLVNLQSPILTEKITETLKMCDVKFKLSDNKADFSSKEIDTTLLPLLKEKLDH